MEYGAAKKHDKTVRKALAVPLRPVHVEPRKPKKKAKKKT